MTGTSRTMEDDLTAIDVPEAIRMSDGENNEYVYESLKITADFISRRIVRICDKINSDPNSRKSMDKEVKLINDVRWNSGGQLSPTSEEEITRYRAFFTKDNNDVYAVLKNVVSERGLVPLFVFAIWSKRPSDLAEKINTDVKAIMSEFHLLRNARNMAVHGKSYGQPGGALRNCS